MNIKHSLYLFLALFLVSCSGATAAENLATATDVPPTATDVPPTATDVPPTATDVPPTATAVPPTATPSPIAGLSPELSGGDVELGSKIAGKWSCTKCHSGDNPGFAPSFKSSDELPPILERGEMRITDPTYSGQATNNIEYILESLFEPKVYFVPGEWEQTMPANFVNFIKDEDLPHLIAWIASFE